MKETDLNKNYTMQQLLAKLDVLECYDGEKYVLMIDGLLDKRFYIYTTLGTALPTLLC